MRLAGHVFAYGSLARDLRGEPAVLRGARRTWGVAMDNRRVIPGYKVWLDPRDGSRPAVHVAFLDLAAAHAGARVRGVLVPVSAAELERIDARERNYARVDVTDHLAERPRPRTGRIWAYVGTAAGRARFRAGTATGTAVVARAYLDAVRAAFSAAVPGPPAPVRRLE
ncbi:MAG TPA: gamma-glutamylcyclotransferase family protein, partial [Solirubrobacteraceae bacterium]|nr:gamma-glutamylcyclotransferase family protein [Solirubrobacteraceae bacterium]